jgi:hypothetical protein
MLFAALAVVSMTDRVADTPLGIELIPQAQAIIGRPLTPISYAGVARRTTRRAVAVTSTSVVAAESAAAASAAQPAASAPAASAAAAPGALPLGTIVASLPSGCTQVTSGGVEYYRCGADYYRTAFQGTNLVYVTAQP